MDAMNQNEIHASTSNGGITVHLPGDVGANLNATPATLPSRPSSKSPRRARIEKHHLEGKIGAGGPAIDYRRRTAASG